MGQEKPDSADKRYEVVEEYMQLCYELWDSWDDDAIIYDRDEACSLTHRKCVRSTSGASSSVRGAAIFVAPSPQRRPVLWQAGSSEPGREFASKHAESVFGIFPDTEEHADIRRPTSGTAQPARRDPESVKLIYGMQTIIDRDRRRAQDKYAEFVERVPDRECSRNSSEPTGFDF